MRAAAGDARLRGARHAADCDRRFAAALEHRAGARERVHELAAIGCVHDTEDRHAVLDQRDVHGEFAVALDELARAVERIDQPVTAPPAALFVRNRRRLLRQHRQHRLERAQPRDDHAMRGEVGLGQRRTIVLVRDLERMAVHGEDRLARAPRDLDDRGAQRRGPRLRHAPPRSSSRAMNSAAIERPSVQSSRCTSSCRRSSFHGTTSSSSGSSPSRRSG